jgi:beta-mannanase
MTSLASLYPGAAYVDWTCLDTYNFGTPWTSFARLVSSSYSQVQQFAPTKPMIIGEVATTGHGGSKAHWIRGMFKALSTRFPDIHGLVWFDKRALVDNKPYDWPIETSRAASAAFSKGISRKLATN